MQRRGLLWPRMPALRCSLPAALYALASPPPFSLSTAPPPSDRPCSEADAVAAAEAASGKVAKDTDSDDAAAQKAAIPRSNSILGRTASAVGQRVDSISQSKFGQAVKNNRVVKFVTYGLTYDMHRVLTKDTAEYNERASRIWDNAERFDWRAEAVFKYIQVSVPGVANRHTPAAHMPRPLAANAGQPLKACRPRHPASPACRCSPRA